MDDARDLAPHEAGYPPRLLSLPDPPPVSIAGDWESWPATAIAIVGTRTPCASAVRFTEELAAACIAAGAIVLSGGAVGVDAAAHRGAIDAGGPTCAVLPTGRNRVFPLEHEELYREIRRSGGTLVWPFPVDTPANRPTFFGRNRVLAALCDALVIVQAGFRSGARNTASWGRKLGRPRWVVLSPPWASGFEGCALESELGARPLTSIGTFLSYLGLPYLKHKDPETKGDLGPLLDFEGLVAAMNPHEIKVFSVMTGLPRHVDEIVGFSGLSTPQVMSALLTLALEHVLVEGPDGFFRRA